MYTSGTTGEAIIQQSIYTLLLVCLSANNHLFSLEKIGKPKGVILTHRQLTESLLNIMHMQEEMKISLVGTAYAAYLPMG